MLCPLFSLSLSLLPGNKLVSLVMELGSLTFAETGVCTCDNWSTQRTQIKHTLVHTCREHCAYAHALKRIYFSKSQRNACSKCFTKHGKALQNKINWRWTSAALQSFGVSAFMLRRFSKPDVLCCCNFPQVRAQSVVLARIRYRMYKRLSVYFNVSCPLLSTRRHRTVRTAVLHAANCIQMDFHVLAMRVFK